MLGVKTDVEKVRRTDGRDKDGKKMAVVRLRNKDLKRKIIEKSES